MGRRREGGQGQALTRHIQAVALHAPSSCSSPQQLQQLLHAALRHCRKDAFLQPLLLRLCSSLARFALRPEVFQLHNMCTTALPGDLTFLNRHVPWALQACTSGLHTSITMPTTPSLQEVQLEGWRLICSLPSNQAVVYDYLWVPHLQSEGIITC